MKGKRRRNGATLNEFVPVFSNFMAIVSLSDTLLQRLTPKPKGFGHRALDASSPSSVRILQSGRPFLLAGIECKEIHADADTANDMGTDHGLDRQHQIHGAQAWWTQTRPRQGEACAKECPQQRGGWKE
jgi:hypothetical protein